MKLSPHQLDAAQRVFEILNEHFAAFVVLTLPEFDSPSDIDMSWSGGYHTAMGLMADGLRILPVLAEDGEGGDDEEPEDAWSSPFVPVPAPAEAATL